MSVSKLETAVLELVGDRLVNQCGRPIPDRVLRYHGTVGLPEDCCTANGVLSITWERAWPTNAFPGSSAQKGTPCPGYPVLLLVIRYVVCWPAAEVTQQSIVLDDTTWDAEAAMLADTEDCIARTLMRLSCDTNSADAFEQAVLAATAKNGFAYSESLPTGPKGGCAGIIWKAYASVKAPT